jgi:hypothetical protein
MKDEPGNRNDSHPQPKTRGIERIRDAIPIIDIEIFVCLAEEIKQRPRQNGSQPIDDEVERC